MHNFIISLQLPNNRMVFRTERMWKKNAKWSEKVTSKFLSNDKKTICMCVVFVSFLILLWMVSVRTKMKNKRPTKQATVNCSSPLVFYCWCYYYDVATYIRTDTKTFLRPLWSLFCTHVRRQCSNKCIHTIAVRFSPLLSIIVADGGRKLLALFQKHI